MPDTIQSTTTTLDSVGLPFTIFRASNALIYDETEAMAPSPDAAAPDPKLAALMGQAVAGGVLEGSNVRLLFSRPGMSLSYAWFKSGFPLPRHTHNADCLYFIVAGTLELGTETLGPGDGFFVGSNVPYTYTPGPQGVEVLEFRTADKFDIKLLANNPAWWEKALSRLAENKPNWPNQQSAPSGLAIGPQ